MSKQCDLQVWQQDDVLYGEIRFKEYEDADINIVCDLIAKDIQTSGNLELLKDDGYPTVLDLNYLLFKADIYATCKDALENHRKQYAAPAAHPGLLAFLFKTAQYKEWIRYGKEKEQKELALWQAIGKSFSFSAATDHDYPYVLCSSRIHAKEELIAVIKKIASALHIDIQLIHHI